MKLKKTELQALDEFESSMRKKLAKIRKQEACYGKGLCPLKDSILKGLRTYRAAMKTLEESRCNPKQARRIQAQLVSVKKEAKAAERKYGQAAIKADSLAQQAQQLMGSVSDEIACREKALVQNADNPEAVQQLQQDLSRLQLSLQQVQDGWRVYLTQVRNGKMELPEYVAEFTELLEVIEGQTPCL